MTTINAYLSKWQQIPMAVKQFLIKGVIMLALWKIIYLGFLFPGRIIDAPLTNAVGKLTVWGLNIVTHPNDYYSKEELGRELDIDASARSVMQRSVYFEGRKVAGVYDSCNALELMVLYAGFIICIPASAKRKWIFITGGLAIVFIVNVLRCIGVVYAIRYYPQHAEFIHHYLFELVVYATIIALWMVFANKINIKSNAEKQA
ncbi:MAG TPA: archaeosortase/exosortase family protein [Mucilaginibacter sp.]|nr:archaeosortase/exosortase family protein [Mucilaginibacter sp.]